MKALAVRAELQPHSSPEPVARQFSGSALATGALSFPRRARVGVSTAGGRDRLALWANPERPAGAAKAAPLGFKAVGYRGSVHGITIEGNRVSSWAGSVRSPS